MPKNSTQKFLIFNWKDTKHPQSGGAEIVLFQILQRLVKDGHKVTLLTARYPGSTKKDIIDGIKIIRVGRGKVTHSFAALIYYIKHLRNRYDIIIEQVNTAPYMVGYFTGSEIVYQFYHQLARIIWFYEFPWLFAWIGYLLLEPIALVLQAIIARIKNIRIITVSNSSKNDLQRFGFDPAKIVIVSEGLENQPLSKLSKSLSKSKQFTVLFHSSLRPMKRPIEVFKAFRIFLEEIERHSGLDPESKNNPKLWVSGGGDQSKLRKFATKHGFINQVEFFGRTTDEQKFELMQKAHVLCSTSIKEGWGLIVTETNSQGTPAISYDVDGLRDSTQAGGGVVVKPNPKSLAKALEDMKDLVDNHPKQYMQLRKKALESSKLITFDQSYKDFLQVLNM